MASVSNDQDGCHTRDRDHPPAADKDSDECSDHCAEEPEHLGSLGPVPPSASGPFRLCASSVDGLAHGFFEHAEILGRCELEPSAVQRVIHGGDDDSPRPPTQADHQLPGYRGLLPAIQLSTQPRCVARRDCGSRVPSYRLVGRLEATRFVNPPSLSHGRRWPLDGADVGRLVGSCLAWRRFLHEPRQPRRDF